VSWRLARWLASLASAKYDLVFDLQGLGRSGLFSLCTRAPRRVGYRDARELGWLGVNVHVDRGEGVHTVDQMLRLVESQGVEPLHDLRLAAPPESIESWAALRRDLGCRGDFALLAPTSRWRCKQWPVERWAALATRALAEWPIDRVMVVGAPGEEDQTRWAGSIDGCVDLCGRLRVGESMAAIAEAAVVVANDSAPLHMAVGLGRPYVGLFGPTDPALVGPYRGDRWVVRAAMDPREASRGYRALGDDDTLMRRIGADEVNDRAVAAMREPAWFARTAEGAA